MFKSTTWRSFLVYQLPIVVILPPVLRVAYLGKSICFLTVFSYLTTYANASKLDIVRDSEMVRSA